MTHGLITGLWLSAAGVGVGVVATGEATAGSVVAEVFMAVAASVEAVAEAEAFMAVVVVAGIIKPQSI
jgi:hypothetical protein